MSRGESYSAQIRSVDTAAEWFLKGANIAFYFGLCLAREDTPRNGATDAAYALRLSKYIASQMLIVGGTIGTMFFISTSLWHLRAKNDGLNYAIGGGVAIALWHKAWQIPRAKLLASCLSLGAIMGLVGHYVIRDRYLD